MDGTDCHRRIHDTEIIEHYNFIYFIRFDESVSVLYNLALEILEISFLKLNCA